MRPRVSYSNVDPAFQKWLAEAANHHFSTAAGSRASIIGEAIMRVGSAKLLYAMNELGLDLGKYAVIFAPDGTFSMNRVRTRRGFSYGCLMRADFNDYLFLHNAMPNGCGYSLAKVNYDGNDDELRKLLLKARETVADDVQLSTGNHFAGVYIATDPFTGEDLQERYVVVHCSGHVGGEKLYDVSWLSSVPGYQKIPTPHGDVTVLTDEAREKYLQQFEESNNSNEQNRIAYLDKIFGEGNYSLIASLTHQGLMPDGKEHRLGVQKLLGIPVPIAFNPEEGVALVIGKENIHAQYYHRLTTFDSNTSLDSIDKELLRTANMVPHGAGYEFRDELKSVTVELTNHGIEQFHIELNGKGIVRAANMREIRHLVTYRRKTPIMQQVAKFDLADHFLDLPYFFQIYPEQSIPGGIESKKIVQE